MQTENHAAKQDFERNQLQSKWSLIGSRLLQCTYAPINAKPHPPLPGQGGGFVNLEVQRTHPRGNII